MTVILCNASWEMQAGPGTVPTNPGSRLLPAARAGGNINSGAWGRAGMLPPDGPCRGAEAALAVSVGFSL